MTVTTLFFGRAIPGGGRVDEPAWEVFVRDAVAPAFPDGFTVLDARGYGAAPGGGLLTEDTKVVVAASSAADASRIDALTAAYRARFRQRSVGQLTAVQCGRF